MNPREIAEWAGTRETDFEVAQAIHNIASERTSMSNVRDSLMQRIWEAPTTEEHRNVSRRLPNASDPYCWGQEKITKR